MIACKDLILEPFDLILMLTQLALLLSLDEVLLIEYNVGGELCPLMSVYESWDVADADDGSADDGGADDGGGGSSFELLCSCDDGVNDVGFVVEDG